MPHLHFFEPISTFLIEKHAVEDYNLFLYCLMHIIFYLINITVKLSMHNYACLFNYTQFQEELQVNITLDDVFFSSLHQESPVELSVLYNWQLT